jgi:predicted DNA-binding WGR domain protein
MFIASAMLVGSPAFAQPTRDQVKAEFAEAVRTGDIMSNRGGQKLNERFPDRYPAKQAQSTLTREQVKAELAEAQRTGDMVVGQSGRKLNEIFPDRYPVQQPRSTLTRDQVNAELVEAQRTGNYVMAGEESGLCNEVHPYMHAMQ